MTFSEPDAIVSPPPRRHSSDTVAPLTAIVDPYGPGDYIVGDLIRRGHRVVKVETGPLPALGVATILEDTTYAQIVKHGAAGLGDVLAALGVSRVLAGSEVGLPAAAVARRRITASRETDDVAERHFDKSAMYAALEVASMPVLRWASFGDPATAISFAAVLGYPVILKPARASGSDGVQICRSSGEISAAFAAQIGTVGVLGTRVDALIVQEFGRGEQFEINLIREGENWVVTDVWLSVRRQDPEGRIDFATAELIDTANHDAAADCCGYAVAACRAIDLPDGPALVEVLATDSGPRLIEINARHDGHTNPSLLSEVTGLDCLARSVSAMLGEDAGLGSLPPIVRPLRDAAIVLRRRNADTAPVRRLDTRWLARLPAFHSARLLPAISAAPRRPAVAAGALVYLMSDRADVLEAGIAMLHAADDADVFTC